MNKRLRLSFLIVMVAGILLAAPPAYADNLGLLVRGVAKTVGAVFEIPRAMIEDSGRVMFPFGIVTGAVTGTVKTVGSVLSGALDIAQGAAPYAKYAILFI